MNALIENATPNGRGRLRRVISESARAAIVLVTVGMAEDARSGPRHYDVNLLLDRPHPYAVGAPSPASASTSAPVERMVEPTPASDSSASRRVHDYTFRLQLTPWLTQVTGEVSRDRSNGASAAIDLHDDLGLDDFEANLAGAANFRFGRHDFGVDALVIGMSASDVVERSITFDSLTIDASQPVRSDIDMKLYDFRYGYSFFDSNADGFRLGPTLAVAYLKLEVAITDEESGEEASIVEEFPLPRVGLQGEMPFGDFLVEAGLSGLYIDYDEFEGYAVEGDLSVTWRPYRYFGVVGGYRVIAIDVDHGRNNYDVTFHGPYLGFELRY